MSIKGLNNIGNTCYLNSGLQMLVQNIDLCQIILHNNVKVMSDFIKEYYTGDNQVLTPLSIKTLVSGPTSIFNDGQQDAGEFIVYLLDILNTELKGNLDNLFAIKVETTIKCKLLSCLKKSIKVENNNYLFLPIKSTDKTLDDCYRGFKVHEKLEKDDMYYCESCQEKRIASKRVNVINWNKHLIMILKRFGSHNGRSMKNNQSIEIPIKWRHNYTIKGAVLHTGGINGGHYIYLSRIIKDDIWVVCDDSNIAQLNPEQVALCLSKAYIFHYIKTS